MKTHKLFYYDGKFIVLMLKEFPTYYPIADYTFQTTKKTKKVILLNDIELPLLGYSMLGNNISLYFYHPDFPEKVLLWNQRGWNIRNVIANFLTENDIKNMNFLEGLPIVKISAGKTKMVYEKPYILPKMEITDFLDIDDSDEDIKGFIKQI